MGCFVHSMLALISIRVNMSVSVCVSVCVLNDQWRLCESQPDPEPEWVCCVYRKCWCLTREQINVNWCLLKKRVFPLFNDTHTAHSNDDNLLFIGMCVISNPNGKKSEPILPTPFTIDVIDVPMAHSSSLAFVHSLTHSLNARNAYACIVSIFIYFYWNLKRKARDDFTSFEYYYYSLKLSSLAVQWWWWCVRACVRAWCEQGDDTIFDCWYGDMAMRRYVCQIDDSIYAEYTCTGCVSNFFNDDVNLFRAHSVRRGSLQWMSMTLNTIILCTQLPIHTVHNIPLDKIMGRMARIFPLFFFAEYFAFFVVRVFRGF